MKSRIVRIGNSRGVRLPKALIDQANLSEEVELHAVPGSIVVKAVRRTRDGWADAARQMSARGEDDLLDTHSSTEFDEKEWEWR